MRPQAARLLGERLDVETRVLVLGAGGWFGSTALALLGDARASGPLLALTGRPRTLELASRSWVLEGWDWEQVERFAPSLVVNCAFLTRERVAELGHDRYLAENLLLSSRFLRVLTLPSVRGALTVSSGAAALPHAAPPDVELNPYGYLKWCEEILAAEVAAARSVALVVCRTWSVSGSLVTRPHDYAFSDLILQASAGRVEIRAAHEVWRRYVGADDLLAVSLADALDGVSHRVESGGQLVELGELARAVVECVRPGSAIERPAPDGSDADRYHSDNRSWSERCARLGYVPATLEEQIDATAAGLLAGVA